MPLSTRLKRGVIVSTGIAIVLGLSACSPLTILNAVTPASSYKKSADIAYGDDPRQRLDVYTPVSASSPAPVVVFFYGGSWNKGERADYAFVGSALASRGIVTVVADYRLYPQVRYPSFIEDSAAAVAWTNKQIVRYGGDAQHIFVMGHSSGAYNAAMVALDKRWLAQSGLSPTIVRGWIGLAGPYDFLPIENPDVKPVFHFPYSPPESQPIKYALAGSPPALLIAASEDKLVNPQRNTGGMATKLKAAGVSVKELYFSKPSHATLIASLVWPFQHLAPVLDEVDQFIKSDGGRTTTDNVK
ncbi:alpha/beta hydrolase [Herminiimonas fonticola]|uniref:Acetyl esterase/lipase n=1 Tax=Herminiimonas fonticola TaxID=303380 RepID=A0A4R6G567_9BURK|nr:alpha/beta hydrolase [Herminiimonas fonticola]RBA23025.1 Esterase/lipase [Herminiimonas fonticola]TDN89533.1 acetyl esterase/lipase [Herminiimonas fonticola]